MVRDRLRALRVNRGDRSKRGPGGAGDGGRPRRRQALRERVDGDDVGTCTNSAPCATIGYALDQAASGATIKVAAGTYPEQLVINKSVSIVGRGSNPTIIEPSILPVGGH